MQTDEIDDLMQPVARSLAGWPGWRIEHLRLMKAGRLRWIAAGGEYETMTGPEAWIERRAFFTYVAHRLQQASGQPIEVRRRRRVSTRTSRRPRLWNHRAFV